MRFLPTLAAALLALAPACADESLDEVGGAADAVTATNRYVINFASGRVPSGAAAAVARAGGQLVGVITQVGVGYATSSDPAFTTRLLRSSSVQSVGPMQVRALAEPTAVQPYADAPTATDFLYELYQWDIRRVRADRAWSVTAGSHDTVVAVIDTGVAWNHPDLAPNVVDARCYAVLGACGEYPQYHWHGTHVAGTVAAAFDGGLTVGVGPELGIASYNVFELFEIEGELFLGAADFSSMQAIVDAAGRGYRVANLSLGGVMAMPGSRGGAAAAWTAWVRVAQYATRQGLTIVTAAGNSAMSSNGPTATVPGDLPGVVNVSATGIRPLPVYPQDGATDVLTEYSNHGASIELAAPGGDIGPPGTEFPFPAVEYLVMSTYAEVNPDCAATASCDVLWAWAAGTSMAAPHVAGVAGLVADADPSLDAHGVRDVLLETAQPIGAAQQFGHGMVDAAAAVGAP